MLTVKQMGRIH